jgi:hypothetical protein
MESELLLLQEAIKDEFQPCETLPLSVSAKHFGYTPSRAYLQSNPKNSLIYDSQAEFLHFNFSLSYSS